ncbi:MAG: HTH-type transcriptional regulator Mce2R [Candidatus Hydrogenedentes bacterium ADurb.Bin179]|nr:MAG: HTH-type transcriptional regulator Mce2R [Candidatus Hydrogenedentes bacterium ADurb.Bin179]
MAEILTRRIVSGEYQVRSKLPTERLLSEEFGVNRHAVREALKRLEAIGLVEIKHGSGIYVQPLHLTAGIEIFDAMLFRMDGSLDPTILSNMLDFRRHVMINLTELSVQRRKPRELGRICRVIDDICFNRRKNLMEDEGELFYNLFENIAAATQNRVYSLVFITLSQVFRNIRASLSDRLPDDRFGTEDLMKLREAFERSDKEAISEIISRWLSVMETALAPYCVPEENNPQE